jgi:hypothetical protein
MKKNYIVIVRDHSGSMQSIAAAAARDYNDNIAALKEGTAREGQDTIVSTVKCGDGKAYRTNLVSREIVNSNVSVLKEIKARDYDTDGGSTPLFDSVGEAISIAQSVPDASDPDVSFLIMVITDGQENSSKKWDGGSIGREIKRLQGTDHWTFTFRVPFGGKRHLVSLGIPDGNILEWEQTDKGFQEATVQTRSAISNYLGERSRGLTSSKGFYTDLSGVKSATVKAQLVDISNEVKVWTTDVDDELIREFCERKSRKGFLKGAAFYQLVKTEKKVQDYKQIVIKDKKSGAFYSGQNARNLLGLPHVGEVKIIPGNHGMYDIFIQSTSVNRKLPAGTQVLYWEAVGTPYIEGKSAPWGK